MEGEEDQDGGCLNSQGDSEKRSDKKAHYPNGNKVMPK